jgi:hypothetical protein
MTTTRKRWALAVGVTAAVLLILASAAIAGTTLKGSYGRTVTGVSKNFDGAWVIAFKGNGHYTVAVKGHIIGKGTMTAKGDKATLRDSACKPKQVGSYTYALKGLVLTFTRISDPCPGRSTVLAKPLHRKG